MRAGPCHPPALSPASGNFDSALTPGPVVAPATIVAADEDFSVENRRCQLRDTVQLTVLALLGHARHTHQDWFDDNDAAISKLLAGKNCPHTSYVNRPTDDNKADFYRSRHFV
nr:unnamed protein product [Spirometra erinaceieuropaei]